MLQEENFVKEHIRELQKSSGCDPALLEHAVYAFGLLEALARVGTPFIFKGGTCLMLLMEQPRRLSTDIDIMAEPGTNIEEYLKLASKIFPFRNVDEQKRIGKNSILKRHFKFAYNSPINSKPFYILLDALYEHNHYSEIVTKEIKNDLLLTEPEYIKVCLPSANCMLADKLTAFAPHTTGIPLNVGKNKEVVKQFYDVASLIDIFTNFKIIGPTYKQIALTEIAYRGIKINVTDCLWDTFSAAFCIASRGKSNKEEYALYVKGISDVNDHIYSENFTGETAVIKAAKIMYLTACLLTNTEFQKVVDYNEFINMKLNQEKLLHFHRLRKTAPETYAYIVKTDKLFSNRNIMLNDVI